MKALGHGTRRRGWLLAALAVMVVLIDLLVWRLTVYRQVQQREEARLELWQMNLPFTREAFFKRVKEGDVDAVHLFLTAGMNPLVKNPAGETAILIAQKYHHNEIMNLLSRK